MTLDERPLIAMMIALMMVMIIVIALIAADSVVCSKGYNDDVNDCEHDVSVEKCCVFVIFCRLFTFSGHPYCNVNEGVAFVRLCPEQVTQVI